MSKETPIATFNPHGKSRMTYAECLGPAMKITDRTEANQYFADYVAYIQRDLELNPRTDGVTATEIARCNLGYYAGYYDDATRKRVEQLFSCEHPIFGKASAGIPTIPESLATGLRQGKALLRKTLP